MTNPTTTALAIAALLLAPLVALALEPTWLKTEFIENPLGLDTAKPRFSWIVEDPAEGAKQTAYQVQASSSERKLAQGEADLWDSGKITSDQSHLVEYSGKPLASRQQVWWRVKSWDKDDKETAWSRPASLETGLMAKSDWGAAEWISAPTMPPDDSELSRKWIDLCVVQDRAKPGEIGRSREDVAKVTPAAWLRKSFSLPGKVKSARLYLSSLGFFEVTINGRPVDDHRMETSAVHPTLFSYSTAKDITALLQPGENCLGLLLGNGRQVEGPRFHAFKDYGAPTVLTRLVAEMADGTQVEVFSDSSWKTARSSVLRDSYWIGEVIDATQEQKGWDRPGFDDSSWKPAEKHQGTIPPKTVFQSFPPERITRRVKPVKLTQPAPGVWVYDMGETLVGTAELRAKVPRGTEMALRYSEDLFKVTPVPHYDKYLRAAPGTGLPARQPGMIAPKGRGQIFFTRPIPRDAAGKVIEDQMPAYAVTTDLFRAAGAGEEVFARKFGVRPFRYVELTGYPGTPGPNTVTGLLIHTDLPKTGTFTSSNPLLEQIEDASAHTIVYLLHGYQWDNAGGEKGHFPLQMAHNLGIYAYTRDVAAVTDRMLAEIRDYCGFAGTFPEHLKNAPSKAEPFSSMVEANYHTELPRQQALYFGDRRILEKHYDLMRGFIAKWFENPKRPTPLIDDKISDHNSYTSAYDLPQYFQQGKFQLPEPMVPGGFFGTAMGQGYIGTVIGTARLLGRPEDAARYRKLQESVQKFIREKFLDPATGTYCPEAVSHQTINAVAIGSGLATEAEKPALAKGILRDMREKWNGHLSTGSRGSYPLLAVLSAQGHVDAAYAIMARTNYPSLGHMLSFGSKTIGECWESPEAPPIAAGVQAEGFTQMTLWFYEWLCGIQPDPEQPGFKHFFLRPHVPRNLTSAGTTFQSPYGKITSSWKQDGETLRLTAEVPWNTSATLEAPGFQPVSINGKPEKEGSISLSAGHHEVVLQREKKSE